MTRWYTYKNKEKVDKFRDGWLPPFDQRQITFLHVFIAVVVAYI
jgi:hypothetical protein